MAITEKETHKSKVAVNEKDNGQVRSVKMMWAECDTRIWPQQQN